MKTSPDRDTIPLERISAPARRALTATGITTVRQLANTPFKTLANLHGVGPKVLRILGEILDDQGLTFRDGE